MGITATDSFDLVFAKPETIGKKARELVMIKRFQNGP